MTRLLPHMQYVYQKILQFQKENSWMRNPRYKHEDLNNGQRGNDDESDKHLMNSRAKLWQ